MAPPPEDAATRRGDARRRSNPGLPACLRRASAKSFASAAKTAACSDRGRHSGSAVGNAGGPQTAACADARHPAGVPSRHYRCDAATWESLRTIFLSFLTRRRGHGARWPEQQRRGVTGMLDFVPAPTRCINPLSCEVLLALDIFFVKPCPARGRKRPSAVGRPATARADRPSPQPAPMRCKPNRPARLRAQIAPPGWPGHPGIRSCRGGPVGVRQGLRYRPAGLDFPMVKRHQKPLNGADRARWGGFTGHGAWSGGRRVASGRLG
jgi:hypothetical protein